MYVRDSFKYALPTKKQTEHFYEMVPVFDKSLIERQKKKQVKEPLGAFVPCVRGTKRELVPTSSMPCDVCAEAQYNAICQYAYRCAALACATIISLGGIIPLNSRSAVEQLTTKK